MACDQHDLRVAQRFRVFHQLHPAAIGQHQVQQDHIRLLQGELASRIAQRPGRRHGETFCRDQRGHHFSRVCFVINHQCMRHH